MMEIVGMVTIVALVLCSVSFTVIGVYMLIKTELENRKVIKHAEDNIREKNINK